MATATRDRQSLSQSTRSRRRTISFRDRLASLTHYQAAQLLGSDGADLLRQGGLHFTVDPDDDIYLGSDLLRVRVKDLDIPPGAANVMITMGSGRQHASAPEV